MKKFLVILLVFCGCVSKETIILRDINRVVMLNSGCSGVLISPNGHIISCAHCLHESTAPVSVSFYDNDITIPAKVLKIDNSLDLALLKIEDKTPYVTISQEKVKLGDDIFVIGHPGDFPWSVSHGIISGFHRQVRMNKLVLFDTQTDAAINPGNSGGGVFNTKGQLIGISEICYSFTAGSNGLNLFIPVSYVTQFLADYNGLSNVTGNS